MICGKEYIIHTNTQKSITKKVSSENSYLYNIYDTSCHFLFYSSVLFHFHKHACHVPLNSFKDALNGLRPAFEKQCFRYNHFSNCFIDSNGLQCLFQFCILGLMPPNCISSFSLLLPPLSLSLFLTHA